jgi:hypothetical protein
MARADYLEVNFSPAAWMMWAHALISLLGIVAVMISPGSWTWKIFLSSAVIFAFVLIAVNMADSRFTGVIRLFHDGTAVFWTASEKRVFATLGNRNWVSPWLCSVPVYQARGGNKRFLVICASNNDPQEYRRLLKFLRMRAPTAASQRMIW